MPFTNPHDAEEMLGVLLESDVWRNLLAPALEEQERRQIAALACADPQSPDECYRKHLEARARIKQLRQMRTKPEEFFLLSEKP